MNEVWTPAPPMTECPLCGEPLGPEDNGFPHKECTDGEQAYADWVGEQQSKWEAAHLIS